LNSPIKWIGGKSRLRKHVIALLPPHSCYVEPFAGAAWVLFGKPPSPVEVINDIDQELINFFRVVKEQPEKLIASFEWELVSRAEFKRLATLDLTKLDEIQRAHRFYYLIMAGWGGEINYPRFQTSITDAGHGNRLIGALKTLRQRLEPVYQRLRTVIIENLDWQACLDRYDRPGTVSRPTPAMAVTTSTICAIGTLTTSSPNASAALRAIGLCLPTTRPKRANSLAATTLPPSNRPPA
jgi:DNA adenine methylase